MALQDLCPWPECASVIGMFYLAGRARALWWRGLADTSSPCHQVEPGPPHSLHPTGKATEEGNQVAFLLPHPTPPGHRWAGSPECRPLLSSSWSDQANILPLQNQAQEFQGCLPAGKGVTSPACLSLSQGSLLSPTLLHQTAVGLASAERSGFGSAVRPAWESGVTQAKGWEVEGQGSQLKACGPPLGPGLGPTSAAVYPAKNFLKQLPRAALPYLTSIPFAGLRGSLRKH